MDSEGLTDTSQALGRWDKPPLAYVVAELAIAPHYGLAAKIAALQDALRSVYPRTIEAAELLFPAAALLAPGISPPPGIPASPQPLWQLFTTKQTRGILINYRAIALHATTYEDSTEFQRCWSEVLTAIERAQLEPFVERAGLRYLDVIVPTPSRQPVDYLAQSLRGIDPPDGAQLQARVWGLNYTLDDIAVQIRTATPAPLNSLLPPTLNALPLLLPRVMIEAQARVTAQQPIGWIDSDASRAVQRPFNAADIADLYKSLHQTISTTFKALLSDHAKQEWI